ncbi:MAG: hypothetical protein WC312_05270 [Candidatus Omnitrophota bacterium]|jgi:hypothetical protein
MSSNYFKDPYTQELVNELDKELQSINFPRVTFVPVDRKKRERIEMKKMLQNKRLFKNWNEND